MKDEELKFVRECEALLAKATQGPMDRRSDPGAL